MVFTKLKKKLSDFEKYFEEELNKVRDGLLFKVFISLIVLVTFISLSLIYTPTLKVWNDNLRYCISASAQALAALVAILFIVLTLTKESIPDYEVIFKSAYSKMFSRYSSILYSRRLLKNLSVSILVLLLWLLFLQENVFVLLMSTALYIFIMLFAISGIINYAQDKLASNGKDRFFEIVKDELRLNKINYSVLYSVHDEIVGLRVSRGNKYNYIYYNDLERLYSLYVPILSSFSAQLKKSISDSDYRKKYGSILRFLFKESNYHLVRDKGLENIVLKDLVDEFNNVDLDSKYTKNIEYIIEFMFIIVELLSYNNYNKIEDYVIEIIKIREKISETRKEGPVYKSHKYLEILLKKMKEMIFQLGHYRYDFFQNTILNSSFGDSMKIKYLKFLRETLIEKEGEPMTDMDYKERIKKGGDRAVHGSVRYKEHMMWLSNEIKELENNKPTKA